MNKPALPPTTSSKIIAACDKEIANAKKVTEWVSNNPWVNQCNLYLSYPGLAMIKFEPHSRATVIKNLGAAGWNGDSDKFEKTVDGIRFQLPREPVTLFGEIPEAEMLKGAE